jgi:hypothetical protein
MNVNFLSILLHPSRILFLEKSNEGRWHYHLAIEPPSFMEASEVRFIASV